MSLNEKIIYNSITPIIIANRTFVIENINKEVSNVLGYPPQQLLGQSVLILIISDERDEIIDKLNMMRQGQISDHYESSIHLISNFN
jgi:PAS domain S-box-containing protein